MMRVSYGAEFASGDQFVPLMGDRNNRLGFRFLRGPGLALATSQLGDVAHTSLDHAYDRQWWGEWDIVP